MAGQTKVADTAAGAAKLTVVGSHFEFFETNFVVRKLGVSKNARIIRIKFWVDANEM